MRARHLQRGFSVIEALIASAIALMVVAGIASLFNLAIRAVQLNVDRTQAAFLAEEGLEAARMMRDNGWTANIAAQPLGVPFYIGFDGSSWNSTTSNAMVGGVFMRTITVSAAYRNGSQDPAPSGTADTNMRQITSTVSWREKQGTSTITLSTYLTNIFGN